MKKNILLSFLIIIIHSALLYSMDLRTIQQKVNTAKAILSKWHKSSDSKLIEEALVILKEAKKEIGNKTNQNIEYDNLRQEVYMLYFWTNKSRLVKAFGNKKGPGQEPDKDYKSDKNEADNTKNDKKNTKEDSIIFANLIDDEQPHIKEAFKNIKEYTINNPKAFYESEFMYRDIYFDFPKSSTAEIARGLADSLIPKIQIFEIDKKKRIKKITDSILNFEISYKNRKFGYIAKKLETLYDEEEDKITKHIMGEQLKEFKYLDITMKAINDLIQNKKKNYLSADIIGLEFKGSIIGASEKSLSIKTKMGTVSVPWKKVNDKQLADLIGQLAKDVNVSYKITMSVYKLGNASEAFEALYNKTLDDPLFLTKLGTFYFKLLYKHRAEVKRLVDNEIKSAQKLADSKDPSGAIKVLTKCMLQINKTKFHRDQVARLYTAMDNFK